MELGRDSAFSRSWLERSSQGIGGALSWSKGGSMKLALLGYGAMGKLVANWQVPPATRSVYSKIWRSQHGLATVREDSLQGHDAAIDFTVASAGAEKH